MKKNMIVRMLCNGLIFFALLLTQNIAIAQEGSGEKAAQELKAEAALIDKSASDLEAEAWKKYEKGYTEKTPEDKAKASEEAAELFDEAAKAYRKAGNEEKAKIAEGRARAARSNAKTHGPQDSKEEGEEDKKEEQNSIQPTSPWGSIALVGANVKIDPTTAAPQPRFHIGFIGRFPLGGIAPQNVQLTSLQEAVFAPGTMEQITNQLRGEWFIGELSGQTAQAFEMSGRTQAMLGLGFGLRLGKKFELRVSGQHFKSEWSGDFPVVVFPQPQHLPQPPQILQGTLTASSEGFLADADLAYFIASGRIRPYLEAGVQGQFPTQNESGAELAGVALPLKIEPLGAKFSPFCGAGLQVGFLENGFVKAGVSYGELPGGVYSPSVEVGVGWSFGGGAHRRHDKKEQVQDKKAQPGAKKDPKDADRIAQVVEEAAAAAAREAADAAKDAAAKAKDCACWLKSLTYHGQTGKGLRPPDEAGKVEKDLTGEIGKTVKLPWLGSCEDKYVVKVVAECRNATCIDISWEKGVGPKGKALGQIVRTCSGDSTYYGKAEKKEGEDLKKKGVKNVAEVNPPKDYGHSSSFTPCESTFMFAICANTPDNPLSATLTYICDDEKVERTMPLCDLILDTTWPKNTDPEAEYQKYAERRNKPREHKDAIGDSDELTRKKWGDDFETRFDEEKKKADAVKDKKK
ncbi:MAG: cell envelope integrity protein TolA [Saprospiraceae bacterium]